MSTIAKLGSLICLISSAFGAFGQAFTPRQVWDGPYDIRMIAAPNAQAVYLDATDAAGGKLLKADSVIRNSTIQMTSSLLDINNRYKSGSPFLQADIPLPAILCPDPNVPCFQGLATNGMNASCNPKYQTKPASVSKWVTMSYPDYDKDPSTFSSSMSQLDIPPCATIKAAYLYWAGDFVGSNTAVTLVKSNLSDYTGDGTKVFNAGSASGYNGVNGYKSVLFKIPGGGYQTVNATTTYTNGGGPAYVCVSDVTTIVRGTGGGQFWVGNLQSYPLEGGGGSTSGWILVVVFESPLSPPRLISLWDGLVGITKGNSQTFTLTGLTAPATTNFQSYVGFGVLDGENMAAELGGAAPEGLGFQTNNGGNPVSINPFCDGEQPTYKFWTKYAQAADASGSQILDACNGPLFDNTWASVCDGMSSSHITTYDPVAGTNGNPLVRFPDNTNTLGFDAHFIKLPKNAVAPGSTTATLNVNAGPQGGTSPFMAFVAIERLQPKLTMTKTANKNTTTTSSQITYTLKVKNQGNDKSMGGDIILDTLDLATNYTANSFSAKTASGATVAGATIGAVTSTSAGNDILKMTLANGILAGDSILITFSVDVKAYASNTVLWDQQCKRTITNTAWVNYKTLTSGILIGKSNGNDCGIGSDTKVLVQDPLFQSSSAVTNLGPYNASSYRTETVIPHVQTALMTDGGIPASELSLYDIRDVNYARLSGSDLFPTTGGSAVYYAIRNYSTSGACQKIFKLTFNFCTIPTAPVAPTVTPICAGKSTSLNATGTPIGTYFWYSTASGGTPSANPFATPTLNATTKYYLVDSSTTSHCGSLRTAVTVTVNPVPVAPTAPPVNPICAGATADLNKTGTATGTYFWYTDAIGGLPKVNPFTSPTLNTGTNYYLIDSVTTTGCKSTRTPVSVTVTPNPTAPTAPTIAPICSGNKATLNETGTPSGAYFWYMTATGGIPQTNPFTTPAALTANTTFYVIDSITATACKSTRTPVLVTVNPVIDPGAIGTSASICASTSFSLTETKAASGGTGTYSYTWKSSPDGITYTSLGAPDATTYSNASGITTTTYYIREVSSGTCAVQTSNAVKITTVPNLDPGVVAGTTTVCYNGGALISSTSLPSGGSGSYTYQWESSTDNGVTWNPISSATNPTYSPTNLTVTTLFRRKVTSGTGTCSVAYSNVITLTVYPDFTSGGTISVDNAIICSGGQVNLSSLTLPSGGTGTYTYAWSQSDGTTTAPLSFTSVDASNITLTATVKTTYTFIRIATSGACGSKNSNSVVVTVNPIVDPGTIGTSASICSSTPFNLTETKAASGGTGTYSYVWKSSPDGVTYTSLGAPDATTYSNASGIASTTYYVREVTSGTCAVQTSNAVKITTLPSLDPGVIAGTATICYNGTASLSSTTDASGGNGTFTYQWEYSTDNGLNWNPASSVAATYNPTALTVTTLYRRKVTSGTGTCSVAYSNAITITVYPDFVSGGTIQIDKTTICSGQQVNLNNVTLPSGGTGAYTYTWSQTDGITATSLVSTSMDANNVTLSATTKTLFSFTRTATSGTCGAKTSNTVTVTVNPLVSFSVALDPVPDICSSDPNPIVFNATPSPSNIGISGAYSWSLGGSTTNTLSKQPSALTNGEKVKVTLVPSADVCPSAPSFDSNELTLVVATEVIPTITMPTPPAVCAGTPVTFTATAQDAGPGPSYVWTVVGSGSTGAPASLNSNTYAYTPSNGDVVSVIVTSNSTCKSATASKQLDTASVTMTVHPLLIPTVSISADNLTPCQGDNVTFTVDSKTNEGTSPTFAWYVGLALQLETSPIFKTNTLSGTQNISVKMTSNANCVDPLSNPATSNSVAVTVTPRVAPVTGIFANPSGTICAGQSVSFFIAKTTSDTANGGSNVSYEWNVNNGGVIGTGPTFTSSALANNDVVQVRYISSLRCLINNNKVATNQITIKVNTPVVSISGNPTFCSNDLTGGLTAVDNGSGTDQVTHTGPTFTWTTTAGTFTGVTIPRSKLTDGETVKVTMTPGYVCNGSPASATQLIAIYTKPVAGLVATPLEICPGQTSDLVSSAGSLTGSVLLSYVWYKNTKVISGSTVDTLSVSDGGSYTVRIINGLATCYSETSQSVVVQNVFVDAGPEKSMYRGGTVQLEGSSNGNYTYSWKPTRSLSDSVILQPYASPYESTYYTLQATSKLGCTAVDVVFVEVFVPIRVPNAFSPNGDGLNDMWVIDGMEKFPNSKVNVYNRWGSAIYSDNNGYRSPWDGHHNGQHLPTGTYYYVIDLKGSPDQTDQTLSGSLTIVR